MDNTLRASPRFSRRYVHLLISAAITVGFFYLLYTEQSSHSFWEMLAGVWVTGLGIYFVLSLTGVLIRALRYKVLLNDIVGVEKTPGTGRLILISFIRNTLVDLLPARLGELSYIYFLNRAGVPLAAGASSFGFCIVLDILVLLILVAFLLVLSMVVPAFAIGGMQASSTALAIGIVAVAVAGVFLVIRYLPRLFHFAATLVKRLAARLPGKNSARLAAWLEENIEQIGRDLESLAKRGVLVRLCWYTFWLRVLKYTSLYILLLSVVRQWNLGPEQIHPLVSMLAFVFAEASASLPISGLMGFGVYEGTMAFVLAMSNVQLPSLVQVSFLVHLITQVKAYSLGIASMFVIMWLDLRQSRNGESLSDDSAPQAPHQLSPHRSGALPGGPSPRDRAAG